MKKKKLWCIAGRKDAELTSLRSFQPSSVGKAEHCVTGPLLSSLSPSLHPFFLTSVEPQSTRKRARRGEESGQRHLETRLSPSGCAMVQMEDCEEEVEGG